MLLSAMTAVGSKRELGHHRPLSPTHQCLERSHPLTLSLSYTRTYTGSSLLLPKDREAYSTHARRRVVLLF